MFRLKRKSLVFASALALSLPIPLAERKARAEQPEVDTINRILNAELSRRCNIFSFSPPRSRNFWYEYIEVFPELMHGSDISLNQDLFYKNAQRSLPSSLFMPIEAYSEILVTKNALPAKFVGFATRELFNYAPFSFAIDWRDPTTPMPINNAFSDILDEFRFRVMHLAEYCMAGINLMTPGEQGNWLRATPIDDFIVIPSSITSFEGKLTTLESMTLKLLDAGPGLFFSLYKKHGNLILAPVYISRSRNIFFDFRDAFASNQEIFVWRLDKDRDYLKAFFSSETTTGVATKEETQTSDRSNYSFLILSFDGENIKIVLFDDVKVYSLKLPNKGFFTASQEEPMHALAYLGRSGVEILLKEGRKTMQISLINNTDRAVVMKYSNTILTNKGPLFSELP